MISGKNPLGKAFLSCLLVFGAWDLDGKTAPQNQEPVTEKSSAHLGSDRRDGLFRIDFAVTDATGNPVADLAAGDFTLLDGGQPTPIFTLHNSVEAMSEPAPELILVLDTLNLSSQQLGQAESALSRFLLKNGGRLDLPCLLYRLTRDGLFSSLRPTPDGNLLSHELEQKRSPRTVWRAQPLSATSSLGSWDAGLRRNQLSVRALGSIAIDQRDVPGHKVVVWIGPGWPVTTGDNDFEEATELSTRLREARITVDNLNAWPNLDPSQNWHDFLAAPLSQRDMRPERLALPVIGTHTGGLVVESQNDLEPSVERCAQEARSYYTLTFNPPHTYQVDEYRGLGVQVGRPGMTARAPTGYYNEPVYLDNPRPGIEKATVAQLEGLVRSEADLGHRLPNLELTERLSTPRLDALLTHIHGERELQALIAAADLSLALPPPADEVVNRPPPEIDDQRLMIERTYDYLSHSIPKLPDFFALRNTVRYEEPPLRNQESWKIVPPDRTLRFAASEHASVLYRNGSEVVDKKQKIGKHNVATGRARNLETWGTFGPILSSVLTATVKGGGTLAWSRWERGTGGDLAVFSVNVPAASAAQFEVTYCCMPAADGTTPYHNATGYQGEFAINPDTGAIMRVVISADLGEDREPTAPIVRSQVMVEYGPQELGGKIYICPHRSVSISRGRTLRQLHQWAMTFSLYSYFETMINDVTFGGYHKFGSESRILAGFEEAQEPGSAAPPSNPH